MKNIDELRQQLDALLSCDIAGRDRHWRLEAMALASKVVVHADASLDEQVHARSSELFRAAMTTR